MEKATCTCSLVLVRFQQNIFVALTSLGLAALFTMKFMSDLHFHSAGQILQKQICCFCASESAKVDRVIKTVQNCIAYL